MKTIVIFYSYSGKTRTIARELAEKDSADIVEIKDVRRPGKIKAYVAGCFSAMRGKAWKIQPLGADLNDYERLILLSPIWAGNPPPAFNAVMELLPKGKSVSLKMVSSSGKSGCRDRLEADVLKKGSVLENFEDIKAKADNS